MKKLLIQRLVMIALIVLPGTGSAGIQMQGIQMQGIQMQGVQTQGVRSGVTNHVKSGTRSTGVTTKTVHVVGGQLFFAP